MQIKFEIFEPKKTYITSDLKFISYDLLVNFIQEKTNLKNLDLNEKGEIKIKRKVIGNYEVYEPKGSDENV